MCVRIYSNSFIESLSILKIRRSVPGTGTGVEKEQHKKSKTKYRDANTCVRGSRLKAAWEGGRWVCVPLLQEKERREGKRGEGWRSGTRQ